MRKLFVLVSIFGLPGTTNATDFKESTCINRAQIQGDIMQGRKEGLPLSTRLKIIGNEPNPNPEMVTSEMWNAAKQEIKKTAISIYSLPYQDPDKFATFIFDSCMNEKQ